MAGERSSFLIDFESFWVESYQSMCDHVYVVSGGCKVAMPEHDLRGHLQDVLEQDYCPNENSLGTRERLARTRVDHLQWVAAAIQGDEAANEAILSVIRGQVRGTLRRRFGDQPHVREALANLSSHLFLAGRDEACRLKLYRGEASLDSWMVGIAMRLAINEGRRKRPASLAPHTLPPVRSSSSSDDNLVESQAETLRKKLTRLVREAQDQMTDQERVVFRMVYALQRTPSQVASDLNLSRARISQVLKSLRAKVVDVVRSELTLLIAESGLDMSDMEKLVEQLLECLGQAAHARVNRSRSAEPPGRANRPGRSAAAAAR
jgi:RNA polymerase sigma factor (sigma-70 family)